MKKLLESLSCPSPVVPFALGAEFYLFDTERACSDATMLSMHMQVARGAKSKLCAGGSQRASGL